MSNPENRGDSLEGLNGADIANALNEFFLSGGFLIAPSEDPLLVYEKISENTDRRSMLMEQFVSYLVHLGIKDNPLEDTVNYIPRCLNNYRNNTSLRLRHKNASETDIALVEGLTLQDVALYANQQYREFNDRLATMSVGSSEHRKTLGKACFWSMIDERVSLATSLNL
ncbi:MAG: hypothetical protein PHE48_04080 [Candidatus Daviesbacteria bacterium]|nr:hypothetical protein [Candidatus Daviesbacteria bacterium]